MVRKPKTTDASTNSLTPEQRAAAKVAKFNELAPKRMTNALRGIRLIGNLSSRGGYSYTDDQVAKMEQALRNAVNETMNRFKTTDTAKPDGFSF